MNLLIPFLIAIGVSMDAFAVSLAAGMKVKKDKNKKALLLGSTFGFFQFVMPMLGFFLGLYLEKFISGIDHWIAFTLLAYIGWKMLREGLDDGCKLKTDPFKTKNLLVLGIATSIDALSVGLSFAFIESSIFIPALIIGVVTFMFSYFGVLLGHKTGCWLGKRAEIAGGLILIGIGIKILIDHLFFQ